MEASPARAATAAVITLFASMDNVDPALLDALKQGTYVVDPHAVADAILRRHESLADAQRLSAMLVAPELDEPSAGVK
jgi:hypothetical protein